MHFENVLSLFYRIWFWRRYKKERHFNCKNSINSRFGDGVMELLTYTWFKFGFIWWLQINPLALMIYLVLRRSIVLLIFHSRKKLIWNFSWSILNLMYLIIQKKKKKKLSSIVELCWELIDWFALFWFFQYLWSTDRY